MAAKEAAGVGRLGLGQQVTLGVGGGVKRFAVDVLSDGAPYRCCCSSSSSPQAPKDDP